jgi:hypothetical protein
LRGWGVRAPVKDLKELEKTFLVYANAYIKKSKIKTREVYIVASQVENKDPKRASRYDQHFVVCINIHLKNRSYSVQFVLRKHNGDLNILFGEGYVKVPGCKNHLLPKKLVGELMESG